MDRNSPSFVLFPVNNNRTAWRPIGLPVILAVPRSRNTDGFPRNYSFPFLSYSASQSEYGGIKIYIANAPTSTIVAGIEHKGLTGPNNQVYSIPLSRIELAQRQINTSQRTIRRTDSNGAITEAPITELQEGDNVNYTTATGVTHYFTYYADADYFDLSDVQLDTEQLPNGKYVLVYESRHYARITAEDASNEFICIDPNLVAVSQLPFEFNHPGDVMAEFERLTPAIYLDNTSRSQDRTLGLYRIFTDILQDVKDEQDLLKRINFVFSGSPEGIPYLSSLLGWELPYFPQSLSRETDGRKQPLDNLRRAVLRRTVELQNLRGSSKSITRIFGLFGYKILINNLLWTSDAKKLVRIGQSQPSTGPYKNQAITEANGRLKYDWHTEYVESSLSAKKLGFHSAEAPLMFRPQVKSGLDEFKAFVDGGPLYIVALVCDNADSSTLQGLDLSDHKAYLGYELPSYLVDYLKTNTSARAVIFEIAEGDVPPKNPVVISGGSTSAYTKDYGYYVDETLKLRVTKNLDDLQYLPVCMLPESINFDRDENKLKYTLNGYIDESDKSIFVFATYKKTTVVEIPEGMIHSNWYDIQVLNRDESDTIDATALDFALDFVAKLAAFHSLLYLISTRSIVTEVYQVTDFGVGGSITQRYDTDAGKQQVPPAIRPLISEVLTECSNLSISILGYKKADLQYREMVLAGLLSEWQAYNDLKRDNTTEDPCADNRKGQDRVSMLGYNQIDGTSTSTERIKDTSLANHDGTFNEDYSEPVESFCKVDGKTDYAYKGRVADRLAYSLATQLDETWHLTSCAISMGVGAYYTFPASSTIATPGVKSPKGSGSGLLSYSGSAPSAGLQYYKESASKPFITRTYSYKSDNLLGRLYRSYADPTNDSLHYVNQNTYTPQFQFNNLALKRPELGITKSFLHFPGCRFPMMNMLQTDYTSPFEKRPWDIGICDNPCSVADLAPELVVGTNGNEYLVYDVVPHVILGNNLAPDIPDLAGTAPTTPVNFIHKIHGYVASGCPALFLEQQDHAEGLISTTLTGIFANATPVNGVTTDHIHGYPSQYGYVPYPDPRPIYGPYISDIVLNYTTPIRTGYYVTCGSGYKDADELGYRLNCSERSGDSIDLLSVMDLDEQMSAGNFYLDGEISSLLETV